MNFVRKSHILFTLGLGVVVLTSCTGSGGSSGGVAPVSPDQGQKSASPQPSSPQPAISANCGDKSCDPNADFCYQEVAGARVINVSECGPIPGKGPCTIWQRDIGDGKVTASKCVSIQTLPSYTGCVSAARWALQGNPQLCQDSIGCESLSIGSAKLDVVSCLAK